jgi:hypothetical protein
MNPFEVTCCRLQMQFCQISGMDYIGLFGSFNHSILVIID